MARAMQGLNAKKTMRVMMTTKKAKVADDAPKKKATEAMKKAKNADDAPKKTAMKFTKAMKTAKASADAPKKKVTNAMKAIKETGCAQPNPWEEAKYDGFRYKSASALRICLVQDGEYGVRRSFVAMPVDAQRDLDFVAELFAHPEGAKLWENGPVSLDEDGVKAHIHKRLARYQARGEAGLLSWWVFFEGKTPLGFVGGHCYLDVNDDKQTDEARPDGPGLIEICGFAHPEFWGKGWRFSGMPLSDLFFRTYCLTNLGETGLQGCYKTVYAPINPANTHSIGCIERQGFQLMQKLPEKKRHIYSIGHDDLVSRMATWGEVIKPTF